MEPWLISLISIVATIAGALGILPFLGKRWLEKYFKKRDDKEQRLLALELEQEDKKLRDLITESIKQETDPINDKLEKIANGTLDTLRDRILSCYYKCVEKGFRTDYDYQNIHHMNVDYLKLNGNSYVEDVMKRFDALPTKEEYEKTHKAKRKKQVLNEEK